MSLTINAKVTNLNCEACKKIVEKRIKNITNVESINVNLVTGFTEIISTRNLELEELQNSLKGTDYQIQLIY